MIRTHEAGTLRPEHAGQTVTLAGWVATRRDHGGVAFVDLRDASGIVQVVIRDEIAGDLRSEFCVKVVGDVCARPDGNENPDLPTGAVEVVASSVEVLSASAPLPFPIDPDAEVGEEARLRWRYLDLRRDNARALRIRAHVTRVIRRVMDEHRFVDVETPYLTRSTPEGARDFLVPVRLQPGSWYALPQSPQLFKQLLMVAGLERYYQIARCFRDEDLRQDRQPEFTQIDIEASFVAQDDVMAIGEALIAALWQEAGTAAPADVPRLTYAECMERFGCDRPDTRYGLEIIDASEVFRGADFAITRGALDAGGRVRGIRIPGGAAALSRKQQDEIEADAKKAGAMGLLRLKYVNGAMEGPVAKFLGDGSAERLGLQDGDLALFVVGPDGVSSPALDRVRQEVARRMDLVAGRDSRFLWVTDFPLFERDPDTGALNAVHHPFTAPHPDDIALLDSTPERVRALAYDLVFNGTELGGGSIRISDPAVQSRIFSLLGIDAATAQARFGFLLEGLRAGAPPHGGIAFGFDRIAMKLSHAGSLRDVIAFPKTTAARALFEGAPAPVPAADLSDLHLSIEARPE